MQSSSIPKLQLAVDVTDTAGALRLVEQTYPFFDIVEIGTPLIIEEGLAPLETIKARFPDKQYLADVKIVDAGYIEASSAFRRGADLITVLGMADDKTVQGALKAAHEFDGQVMIDLIQVPNPVQRAKELESLGVHAICLHTAYDRQGAGIDPMAELKDIRSAVKCLLAIAGGIKLQNTGRAVSLGADIVVVGGGIIAQPDPKQAAKSIMDKIKEESGNA